MPYRHRKNPMPVSALVQWVSITAVCGVVAFFYVYLKVQMVNKGREIKALDAQIAELKSGNDILANQIHLYTSREYLLKQVAAGFIQLEPIPQERLVRLEEPAADMERLAQIDLPAGVPPAGAASPQYVDFRLEPALAMP